MGFRSLAILALAFLAVPLGAEEKAKDCVLCMRTAKEKAVELAPSVFDLAKDFERINEKSGKDRPPVLEGTFYLGARRRGDAIEVTSQIADWNKLDREIQARTYTLLQAAHTPANDRIRAKFGEYGMKFPDTFKDYLTLVQKHGASLPFDAKLTLLASLGSELYAGYDHSRPWGETPLESVFENMRAGGVKGGICRDIHKVLAEVAKALGLENVGMHFAIETKASKSKTEAHVITHFRDPATGEYYVLNYDTLINTHETQLDRMLEVSSAVLGQLSGTMPVESAPNKIHNYVPATSRWIRQKVEEKALDFSPDRSSVTFRIGERERTVGLEFGGHEADGRGRAKAFYLHSRYELDPVIRPDEKSEPEIRPRAYQIDLFGFAGRKGSKRKVSIPLFAEFSSLAQGYLGFMLFQAPDVSPDPLQDGKNEKTSKALVGGEFLVKGTARIEEKNGKIEIYGGGDLSAVDIGILNGKGADVSYPQNQLKAGARIMSPEQWVSIDVSRSVEIGPRSMTKFYPWLRTRFDKFSIVVDTRGFSKKVYLVSQTDVYLLEGVDQLSALGLRNLTKAAARAGKLGEFAVVTDVSDVVANPSKDPFYDIDPSLSGQVGWSKAINRSIRIGADVDVKQGFRPFYLFQDSKTDLVAPGPEDTKKLDVGGYVRMGVTF